MDLWGFDDGYFNNKTYRGNGDFSIRPTRAKVGGAGSYGMGGKVLDIGTYRTKSPHANLGKVTVSVGMDLQDYDTTDFPDYPLSPINRVMVHHILRTLGAKKNPSIATGLPVEVFYSGKNFSVNEELIDQKKRNLATPVFLGDDIEGESPIITFDSQIVLPEAFAGYYDFVLKEVDGGIEEIPERMEMSNFFVDFGGRTTDAALIDEATIVREQGGRKVSGSLPVGMINYRDKVLQSVGETFGIDQDDLSIKAVDNLLKGTFTHKGEKHDISELLNAAKTDVATVILNDVRKRIKDGVGVDNMIFIGGGASFFKDEILSYYPQAIFPENGIISNARGMYKYLMYSKMD